MTHETSAGRQAPVRLAPDFESEYPGASRRATECLINVGVTWETVEPIYTRLLARFRLSLSAFNVLEILRGATEPLPPSVITDHMLVTRGAMTKILDSLEKRRLVRRCTHPTDRRMLLVEITEAGMTVMNQLLPRLHALEPGWLDLLSAEEQETLVELLGKVQTRFQELHKTFRPELNDAGDSGRE